MSRRLVSTIAAIAALVVATIGVGTALARTDGNDATGTSATALLERLDELERRLPEDAPPTGVELSSDTTWGTLADDHTSVRTVLDTLEPDLRALFIDADDAAGDVAEAVALVARGWLDIWSATTAIAIAEGHDLAFPVDTSDDDGVATGADELRGEIETGIELLLAGRARHLAGYGALEELQEAEDGAQDRLNARARSARTYDEDIRPRVDVMRSAATTSVLVPADRFDTDEPGVRSRATSFALVCVDRDALEELDTAAVEEILAQLDPVDRVDCEDLPGVEQQ